MLGSPHDSCAPTASAAQQDTAAPQAAPDNARLPRLLSVPETWAFGFTGLLLWLFVGPEACRELGPAALLVWLPATLVGILINLQVQRLGAAWPDVAGGTPSYATRLLHDTPWLARYVGMAYFQGWASIPTLSGILLSDVLLYNLEALGYHAPPLPFYLGFTCLCFVIALGGVQTLSILHFFFAMPAVGLLLVFVVSGLGWLALAPSSPGMWPATGNGLSLPGWARWYFLATSTAYVGETAALFVADSRRPTGTLRCLSAVACVMPVVFLGGSWVLRRGLDPAGAPTPLPVLELITVARPFWGASTGTLVTFLIAAGCLLSCATATATAPRVLYQMGRDGLAAPCFGTASTYGVPAPAILFTLATALGLLSWGGFSTLFVVTGTGWFFSFIALHGGIWRQRHRPECLWPRWTLGIFLAEVVIFVVGGVAWGWRLGRIDGQGRARRGRAARARRDDLRQASAPVGEGRPGAARQDRPCLPGRRPGTDCPASPGGGECRCNAAAEDRPCAQGGQRPDRRPPAGRPRPRAGAAGRLRHGGWRPGAGRPSPGGKRSGSCTTS